jgi:hypothetical protein
MQDRQRWAVCQHSCQPLFKRHCVLSTHCNVPTATSVGNYPRCVACVAGDFRHVLPLLSHNKGVGILPRGHHALFLSCVSQTALFFLVVLKQYSTHLFYFICILSPIHIPSSCSCGSRCNFLPSRWPPAERLASVFVLLYQQLRQYLYFCTSPPGGD